MPKQLLVVFGLNGSLVQRCRPVVAANISAPASIEQHTIGIQKVFVRPGVKDGLRRLTEAGHTVGIWSATTMKNTDPIVKQVFSGINFSFVWSRDHTSPDLYRRQTSLGDSDSDHATLKDVSLLWKYRIAGGGEGEVSNSAEDEQEQHDQEPKSKAKKDDSSFVAGPKNTVIFEDDPSKSRRFADNLLWVPTYNVEDAAACAVDESMGFNRAVEMLLGELSEVDDVRKVLPKRVVLC